jgi:hypothetical protein
MEPAGLTRRTVLRRAAVAGGVLWAAPAVTNLAQRAAAASGPPANGYDISFVAVLIKCGATSFQAKLDVGGQETVADIINTPECVPLARATSDQAPAGFTMSGDRNSVTVTIPDGCLLESFRVKSGQCCDGPGAPNQPSAPAPGPGPFVFNRPLSNGSRNAPACSTTGFTT